LTGVYAQLRVNQIVRLSHVKSQVLPNGCLKALN
jgi:hypothetical protein